MSEPMSMPEYAVCRLCPRECGARRLEGERGRCGEGATIRIAAALPHFGEEPSLVGTNGSGTVFFSGCSCGCFFCQNHQISQESLGREYGLDEFTELLRGLLRRGVHNLNFVTPDHFWPSIRVACRRLRDEGVGVPFLWNSSGYERAEVVSEASGLIEVFLPDFKFAEPELAERCMGDRRYPDIARRCLEAMVNRRGFLRPWDTTGAIVASCGTLVRHLVLPGQVRNSLDVLLTLYRDYGPNLPISIMSQFMPMPACRERHFLDSKLTAEEYREVCDCAVGLGFTRVYTQEGLGDDRFAPDFSRPLPFGTVNLRTGRPI